MPENILQRNACVIWYEEAAGSRIFTCLKEKGNLLTLEGLAAWLWINLKTPRTLPALKELLAGDGNYQSSSDNLEETVKQLAQKNILKYLPVAENCLPISAAQREKNVAQNLLKELDSAKKFTNSQALPTYHKEQIQTIEQHFETKEATVSHLYRQPHPALGNLSYGAKLYRKLNSRKKIMPESKILEVGAGLGFLAHSFLGEYRKDHPRLEPNLNYFCLDLTFKFLESQKEINQPYGIKVCQADAQNLPFKDKSIDLLIANENIADFSAVKLPKKLAQDYLEHKLDSSTIDDTTVEKSLEWLKRSSIDIQDALPEFIFNLGAMEFLKEIQRVLKPDGLAFISEYGILKNYPTATNLDGHTEYSIQFNHLLKASQALGLEAELYPLLDFLEFNQEIEVVDSCSLKFISGLLEKEGKELPFLAYTPGMLKEKAGELVDRIKNLKFFKLGKKSVFHNLNIFYVLLLFKGRTA